MKKLVLFLVTLLFLQGANGVLAQNGDSKTKVSANQAAKKAVPAKATHVAKPQVDPLDSLFNEATAQVNKSNEQVNKSNEQVKLSKQKLDSVRIESAKLDQQVKLTTEQARIVNHYAQALKQKAVKHD